MVRMRQVPSQMFLLGHSVVIMQASPVDLHSWHCSVLVSR